MAVEMLEGLYMHKNSPALFLYPWVLAWLVWVKSSGSQSKQIPFDIPVVRLNDFGHPDDIPGKDCPFAIDGERYYFTKQVPRDASGKRSKRKAGKEGAYWKSTSPDINITDLNRNLIGSMRKYTFYYKDDNKDDKRSENWLMEEYRVHDPQGLVDDPYVLCKIYEKKSACPVHTDKSIRSLTNRAIKRKRGSQPDQTNSKFDSMSPSNSNPENALRTQFDNNNFVEDPIMQQTLPTFENFPPNSLPIPRPHDASGNQNRPESIPPSPWNSILMNQSQTQFDNNNFVEDPIMQQTLPTFENFPPNSLSIPRPHDASGNQNRPESIPPSPWNSILMNQSQTQFDNNNFVGDPIMQQTLPTFENFPPNSLPIPRPHDASGNQNRPESIPPSPWNSILMNQSQTQFDNNNFDEDLIMQQNLCPSEYFLSDLIPTTIPCSSFYSNESLHMIDASFSGPSMPHYSFENLNAPDGEESPPDLSNH